MKRRDFIKGTLGAFGSFFCGGLIAAPPGWKHEGTPNLVFGVISDTHLRTTVGGNTPGANWPTKYFAAALEYFKAQNVDAVVHCGDLAHRGQVRELEFHGAVWRRVFAGGPEPVKLFVAGNHDVDGAKYGDFVRNRYPDETERAKHVLATDMPGHWQRIWGEKYEPVWHKEVKGYHFFGRHWGVEEADAIRTLGSWTPPSGGSEVPRPFFYIQHRRPSAAVRRGLLRHTGGVAFFGHNHWSVTNWNILSLYNGRLPVIQCASCEPRGCAALVGDTWITKAKIEGREQTSRGRQGYVVRVYDDMLVLERREFGAGGSLGSDWIMPFGKTNPHPFVRSELQKVIGEPQFRDGAKIAVENLDAEVPAVKLTIPPADANPDSRVYAYEVTVQGPEGTKPLCKAVYAAGVNLGMGHEPNDGVTELLIPKSELPRGTAHTFTVRPLTSLGTAGKAVEVSEE
ncbi:MAG: metallophosphoesterase [Thermoguttaceae bacterium]|nr:metallophosphoesterase [Thermoguttaceae bacterium]